VHTIGKGSGWMSKDYQSGKFKNRFVLPEKEFQESKSMIEFMSVSGLLFLALSLEYHTELRR
jgi:hypothetical protein